MVPKFICVCSARTACMQVKLRLFRLCVISRTVEIPTHTHFYNRLGGSHTKAIARLTIIVFVNVKCFVPHFAHFALAVCAFLRIDEFPCANFRFYFIRTWFHLHISREKMLIFMSKNCENCKNGKKKIIIFNHVAEQTTKICIYVYGRLMVLVFVSGAQKEIQKNTEFIAWSRRRLCSW